MKKSILFWAIVFFYGISFSAFSQDSIAYEMTFYFEDAIGNKDTIEIGGSPYTEGEAYFSAFGEINLIEEPFDSVFEVRVGSASPYFTGNELFYLGKKRILEYTNGNNGTPASQGGRIDNFAFFANCENPPLTVRWSSREFRQDPALSALMGAGIVNSYAPATVEEWDNAGILPGLGGACIGATDSVSFSPFPNSSGVDYLFESYGFYPIEGSANLQDTIPVYYLYFERTGFPPCGMVTDVESPLTASELTVYPNPAQNRLFLNGSNARGDLRIYSIGGALVASYASIGKEGVDVGKLPPGVYLLQSLETDGTISSGKFVKQ